jgi:hypothetical protein
MASELEAPVTGASVVQLRSWSSLWADLLHVDMALHARDQLPENPTNLFVRRALWEGAVVAYGRTAKTGSRQVLIKDLLDALGPSAQRCHDEVMKWRDKHVAHRQDRSRETVTARAIVDADDHRLVAVRVRVSPATGEEDGGQLVSAFKRHIKLLRDMTWEQRIRPLEAQIIAEYADRIDTLLAGARANTIPLGYFNIDINPSDRPTSTIETPRRPNRAERRRRKKG